MPLPTHAELAACQACPLAGPRPVAAEVHGSGAIMLIGEAPGGVEESTGRPFVGPAGKLLRKLMTEAGITSDFAITNMVRHRPPQNRTPTPEEITGCAPWLKLEIQLVAPDVLVLLGGPASRLAFPKMGQQMLKHHGRWEWVHGMLDGFAIPAVTLVHPAYILRVPQNGRGKWMASTIAALVQARKKAEGAEQITAGWFMTASPAAPSVTVDVECDSVDQRVANPILAASTWINAQTKLPAKNFAIYSMGTINGKTNLNLLSSAEHMLMHHSAYDATVLARYSKQFNLRKLELDDSMVLAHTMGLSDATLGGLSARLLGEPIPGWSEVFPEGYDGSDEEHYKKLAGRCALDVRQTTRVWPALRARASAPDLELYDLVEKPLLPIVAEMTAFGGFDTDREGLTKELESTVQMMGALEKTFKVLVWKDDIKITSGAQVADRFEELGWLHSGSKLTPQGTRYSVDKTVLSHLKHLKGPGAAAGVLLDYNYYAKRKSTYIEKFASTKRLTALWHQTGTRTYRFASSGPNLMNVPPDLRHYLRARDGCELVCLDLSQVEYRVAAYLSGDPRMVAAFVEGRDMHTETARTVLGIKGEISPEMRRLAKIFNFGGVLFGGSVETMLEQAERNGVVLTPTLAREGLQRAAGAWQIYYYWCDQVARQALTWGQVKGLYGRLFRFREAMTHHELNKLGRQAVNYPIQGGAADITKRLMYLGWKLGRPILAQVHDEIIWEVKEGEGEDFKQALGRLIKDARFLDDVPVTAEIRVAKTWK